MKMKFLKVGAAAASFTAASLATAVLMKPEPGVIDEKVLITPDIVARQEPKPQERGELLARFMQGPKWAYGLSGAYQMGDASLERDYTNTSKLEY